jgi:hypothetical protein
MTRYGPGDIGTVAFVIFTAAVTIFMLVTP